MEVDLKFPTGPLDLEVGLSQYPWPGVGRLTPGPSLGDTPGPSDISRGWSRYGSFGTSISVRFGVPVPEPPGWGCTVSTIRPGGGVTQVFCLENGVTQTFHPGGGVTRTFHLVVQFFPLKVWNSILHQPKI